MKQRYQSSASIRSEFSDEVDRLNKKEQKLLQANIDRLKHDLELEEARVERTIRETTEEMSHPHSKRKSIDLQQYDSWKAEVKAGSYGKKQSLPSSRRSLELYSELHPTMLILERSVGGGDIAMLQNLTTVNDEVTESKQGQIRARALSCQDLTSNRRASFLIDKQNGGQTGRHSTSVEPIRENVVSST